MASLQELEVQLAQRLASNEKPIRTRAMKKLRKYVQVRSQKVGGGFTLDELLKLWKGLFYCLWMQDKPLLQMDLSKLISAMVHNFQDLNAQLMYLRASMQTFKREWNGLDRLRMDKFFQLVRYVFHQSFEMLKKRKWDSEGVDGFLKMIHEELLRNSCDAPSGLQIHLLDVYLTELAAVGAEELTAEQNLKFIKPFCKVAAETKNQLLFRSICQNIFGTITSQAPFAIEDLIKELKMTETSDLGQDSDSDSGQASDEDQDSEAPVKVQKKRTDKNVPVKQNGKQQLDDDDAEDDDDEEDEHLNLDSEVTADEEDIGPVLQFDYGAIADTLLELASRENIRSRNRKKLYSVVKLYRNLKEGIFPQEHRLSRRQDPSSDEEEEKMLDPQKILKRAREELGIGDGGPAAKKKKKRRKKKKAAAQTPEETPVPEKEEEEEKEEEAEAEEAAAKEAAAKEAAAKEPETEGKKKKRRKRKKKAKKIDDKQNGEATEGGAVETPELSQEEAVDVGNRPVIASKEAEPEATPPKATKKRKTKMEEEPGSEVTDAETPTVAAPETAAPETDPGDVAEDAPPSAAKPKTNVSAKKRKVKKNVLKSSPLDAEPECCVPEEEAPPPTVLSGGKKKRKSEVETPDTPSMIETHSNTDDVEKDTSAITPRKRKAAAVTKTEGDDDDVAAVTSSAKVAKKTKKKKIPVTFEYEAEEVAAVNGAEETTILVDATATPVSSKKKKKKSSDFITFQDKTPPPTPLFCRTKAGLKTPKTPKTPRTPKTPKTSKKLEISPKSESKKVTFHLLKNQTAEFRKSDRSVLLSPEGASRVAFDPEQKPKSGVLKSPASSMVTRNMSANKKTPNTRRRPSAVDFF